MTEQDKQGAVCAGSATAIIVLLLLTALLTGCKTTKQTAATTERTTESVRVEVVKEVQYVPDTVLVEIPAQIAERTTADSVSYLENDYASSVARIKTDGTLFHILMTKVQHLKVSFQKPVINTTTTTATEREATKAETLTEIKVVERELTWWQRARLNTWWYLAAYALALSIWFVKSKFTKIASAATTLLKFIRRVLGI